VSSEIILDRLAEANPVPEHGLEVDDSMLLLAIRERSVDMSTTTENKATRGVPRSANPKDPKRPMGWFVALAAFAIVMVVGAVVLLSTSNTEAPPASPSTTQALPAEALTTPLAVAEGLADWFNSGDAVAFRDAFGPEGGVSTGPDPESGAWDFIQDFSDPQGSSISSASFGLQIDDECSQTTATIVECTWVPRGGVYDRAGISNPATAVATVLFNENTEIVAVSILAGRHAELLSFHIAFGTWLKEAHPKVFDATFDRTLADELGIESCLTRGRIVRDDAGQIVSGRCLTDTMDGRVLWAGVLDEFLTQSDDYPITN
jgi:hypothetical protein